MSTEVCPKCGGPVFVNSDRRAWCIQPYDRDGCGGYWPHWSPWGRTDPQMLLPLPEPRPDVKGGAFRAYGEFTQRRRKR